MNTYSLSEHAQSASDRHLGIFLIVYVVILYCLFIVDHDVATYFASIDSHSPLKRGAQALTHLGEGHWYIVPPLLLYVALRRRFAHAARAALFIAATTVASGLAVNLLKIVFARPRPVMYLHEHLSSFQWFETGHAFASFPSGHSATAFGAWMAFALLAPRRRWWFVGFGALIAFSRVVVGAHYPGDVIAGSYLGAIITILLYRFMILPHRARPGQHVR